MTTMTERERFRETAAFGSPDRAFILPPWTWQSTLTRWQSEGLPSCDLPAYFCTDREHGVPLQMQGPYGPHLLPPLERRVLEETDEHRIVQDEEGNILKLRRDDPLASMPMWIEYPMRGREDWERIVKPRLNASVPGRRPAGQEWQQFVTAAQTRDVPLGIWCGSFYGWPRSLMGVERISVMFFDDPGLIHEMCNHIADFVIEAVTPILDDVKVDFAYIWEDMAGKAGPLCSPKMYRRFMLEPLKRVTAMLHSRGIDTIIVDSDGNNDVLIPLWLEAGVTGLRPFEIAAGCDPAAIRKQYCRALVIQGGIDKRPLAEGPEAIEREVLSKVPWLCLQGGYFPQIDHLVPPDVSLDNYRYYAALVRAVTEDPERYLHLARQKGYWE
jgi:hypothetical protein